MLHFTFADGRGWIFEIHDKLGVLCDRIVKGGCAKVSIARPSKGVRDSSRSNIDGGYAKVIIPRTSTCIKKSDRKTRFAELSVKKKSFFFTKQCYLRYLRNLKTTTGCSLHSEQEVRL